MRNNSLTLSIFFFIASLTTRSTTVVNTQTDLTGGIMRVIQIVNLGIEPKTLMLAANRSSQLGYTS